MIGKSSRAIKIFFSYAHEDRDLRDELERHLGALKRSGQITTWYDREIQPGTVWKREIEKRLDTADIILLLISPEFMASDYCYGIEMKRALERHERGEMRVIPVILRPVDWRKALFSELQALPTDAQPVTSWHNLDEAFFSVAEGIHRVIEMLLADKGEEEQALQFGGTSLLTSASSEPLLQPKIYLSRRAVLIGLVGALVAGSSITLLVHSQVSKEPSPSFGSTATPFHRASPTLYIYQGHYDIVKTVAWSPDGTRIASGGWDGKVQVWDAATGITLLSYRGHSNSIVAVAWSPDSKRIASGSTDNTVQVWNAITGKRIFTHPVVVNSSPQVAWSSDGLRICIDDGTIQVLDSATGSMLLSHRDPTRLLFTMAWSPDNKHIASGGDADGTVHVFNTSTGSNVYTYHDSDSQAQTFTVAWSPNGKRIAFGNTSKVRVFDAINGDNGITLSSEGNNLSLAWSPDGKRIAAGGVNKTVHIWDALTGKHLFGYHGHFGIVEAIAWSPDNTHVASGGEDKTVQVWTPD